MKQFILSFTAAFILFATPITAKETEIIEVDRKFVWVAVPGTLSSSEIGNPDADLDLHYVNTNRIVRHGSLVIFEVVSPDASYTRLEGNCKNQDLHELYAGSFDSEGKLVYVDVDYYPWRKGNELEQKLLNFACNPK